MLMGMKADLYRLGEYLRVNFKIKCFTWSLIKLEVGRLK